MTKPSQAVTGIEPTITPEMVEAARRVADGVDDTAFERIYTAMEAARPTPDLGEDGRLVERLRYGKDVESWWELGARAADRITSLHVDRERMREALKPFAEDVGRQLADDFQVVLEGITAGDVRRAFAALSGIGDEVG